MTANQVLLGVGLILALAVGSQVLASRLRIPALIILLPAGFIAGAIAREDSHVQQAVRLLGPTLTNVPIKTYENVSQFWDWSPEEFLKRGPYKR